MYNICMDFCMEVYVYENGLCIHVCKSLTTGMCRYTMWKKEEKEKRNSNDDINNQINNKVVNK